MPVPCSSDITARPTPRRACADLHLPGGVSGSSTASGCDAGWLELVVAQAVLRGMPGAVFRTEGSVVELVASGDALARLAAVGDVHCDEGGTGPAGADPSGWGADDGVWADEALGVIQAEIERAWGEHDDVSFSRACDALVVAIDRIEGIVACLERRPVRFASISAAALVDARVL